MTDCTPTSTALFRTQDSSEDDASLEDFNRNKIIINNDVVVSPDILQTFSSDAEESSDDAWSDSDVTPSLSTDASHTTTAGQMRRGSKESRLLPYKDLTDRQSACLEFAMEHRIFLKAIMGLWNERDKIATEYGMNDPNVLKFGPLKKASHLLSGVWKVKYVEIRRGMFSYFEDAVSSGDKESGALLQKNIPLDSNETSCRAVKIHRNGLNMVPGAIFELKVGNTGRLWLCRSRAERQAWIQAINDAMVNSTGRPSTQGTWNAHGKAGSVNSRSPFRDDLRLYLKIKGTLKGAKTKTEYVNALGMVLGREPLNIPVRWIMQQVDNSTGGWTARNNPNNALTGAFVEKGMSDDIDQLWRDLKRDTIRINEQLFRGDLGHGPEKMIGALTRDIVGVSRSASQYRYAIPEAKAVAYARDILLSINRTRSGGDSYFCIDTLSSHSELVVLVPSSREAEPLSISVELDEAEDFGEYANEKTGWLRTRNRIQMNWRKRFFVLSEGTLSFYRHATPRPHDMRGQTVVIDAAISVDKAKDRPGYYVVSILPKDGIKERYLYFNNVDKLISWTYTLECVAKLWSNRFHFGRKIPPPNTTLGTDIAPTSADREMVEQAMKMHLTAVGLSPDEIQDKVDHVAARSFSKVRILVRATSEYNVCTTDPQGDDGDTWATLTATFVQRFRITGGKIVRGEEIVQVGVSQCPNAERQLTTTNSGREEVLVSPSLPRLKLGLRRRSC
ncbi:PH domain containing protein [Nitzschia inconspicua]|uniref:PH domain containing protein n=1 Tax=Nitzschia inconspicua TaxID=303405 RepID=A0A9K3KEG7_9STRA|nr:PH domain containing protein [Nitzschia inconspicua]